MSDTLDAADPASLRVASFGAVGTLRKLAAAGRLDVVPCHTSQIGRYLRGGALRCDVAMVQLSPRGPDGRHSMGLINDYMRDAVAAARCVIAEINEDVPWTNGNPFDDEARLTAVLHGAGDVVEAAAGRRSATDEAIAANVASLIEDGDTLQVGVGAVPDLVLEKLRDRRDLGFHSGVAGDALVDLAESGALTNARKRVDRGVSVASTLFGTGRLRRFADRNAALSVAPFDHVYADATLSALDRFVAINSALEVDLTGQVGAESTGGSHVGAIGGQSDFMRAAHRSQRGRAIVALPATARNGAASRICATLSGPVTTGRADVDFVVTEFGVASLRGRPERERRHALLEIAHPDFREPLARAVRADGC